MNASTGSEKLDYVPGKDGMQPGEQASGRVASLLEYRAGDGPLIQIHPDYQLRLERAQQSMVLSWKEDGQPMNASIPVLSGDVILATCSVVIQFIHNLNAVPL